MRVVGAALLLCLVAASAACRQAAASPADPALASARRIADIFLNRESRIVAAVVPPHATLATLLNQHGLLPDEAQALVLEAARHFDLRRVKAGQPYRLDQFLDGRLRAFEYEIDRDRRLVINRGDSTFTAAVAPIPKVTEIVTVEGAISRETPSLVQAMDRAGEQIELSLALAELFAGEVDFTNDLQPGDTFRLLVERSRREDGQRAGYGPVLAAEFVNAGRRLRAIRFAQPGSKADYYDENGRSVRRFFLKSPLKFEPRITSVFSRARRHPILNYTRAHNGVDYAAPTGAPVGAVADGVVSFAGWSGGGGWTVRIRHVSGFESEYLHLSSITRGVRSGVGVAQGEVVGRVGATGLATGPHLHYGLRRHGAYVNPRAHHGMPPGEPVAAAHVATFQAERDRLIGELFPDSRRRAVN